MEFRLRPTSNYLLQGDWEELYVLTEHWRSDFDYFRDELSFFQLLFDKYFEHLISPDKIKEAREVAALLKSLKAEHTTLTIQVDNHLMHISDLLKNPFVQNESQFRDEHILLEDQFVDFVKRFRETKKKLFSVVERVSKNEKQKHLLT